MGARSDGESEPVHEGSDEDQREAQDADVQMTAAASVQAEDLERLGLFISIRVVDWAAPAHGQPNLLNALIMLMAPGPMMTMKSAGKMHSSIGKRILTGTFCAFSSAS